MLGTYPDFVMNTLHKILVMVNNVVKFGKHRIICTETWVCFTLFTAMCSAAVQSTFRCVTMTKL